MANKPIHPTDGIVWACPDCDGASQLHERHDGTIACYDCGGRFDGLDDLVHRADRRGENFTEEDYQRFAAGSTERFEGPPPNPGENLPRGGKAKYEDLTLADVGLEDGPPSNDVEG